ncbi:hypothetical protein NC651_022397 [Populus alba x Populus x berolinensis]|nr:hypothetical protein NC651_022397 [Populus alba x Populus x berolinensis]
MSSYSASLSYSKKGQKGKSEAPSYESKPRKSNHRRESMASSRLFPSVPWVTPSYEQLASPTYEKNTSKHGNAEEEVISPVRRSSRIRHTKVHYYHYLHEPQYHFPNSPSSKTHKSPRHSFCFFFFPETILKPQQQQTNDTLHWVSRTNFWVNYRPMMLAHVFVSVVGLLFIDMWFVVEGVVRSRPVESVNKKLITGSIEVVAEHVQLLNAVKAKLPFLVTTADDAKDSVKEEIRLRYRCLDLRRQQMSSNIMLRHRVVKLIRRYLEDVQGFVEIETPYFLDLLQKVPGIFWCPQEFSSALFSEVNNIYISTSGEI